MKLNILEFETRHNKYIFDGVTSSVFAVDDIIMDCLKLFEKNISIEKIYTELSSKYCSVHKVKAAINFVQKYAEQGAFFRNSDKEWNKLEHGKRFSKSLIQKILKAGYIQQLVLNVTENCNMRCKYCYVSEAYKYTRNRTGAMMSEKTAIESLDYFFGLVDEVAKFNPGKKCAITFYGGEALLNFEVIKKSIEYAKENCPVTPMFNITTNGTLLYGDKVDYLVENNVAISVSLDGVEDEHDRNRVDVAGAGTFEVIVNNIKKLKEKYPDYHKVNFAAVYDLKTNFEKNDCFFEKNSKTLPYVGMVSPVVDNGTDYYSKYNDEDIKCYRNRYFHMLDKYIDCKIKNKKMSSYLEMLFELQLANVLLRVRGKDEKLSILPFTCTCVPGMKISVRPDGKFDICEKVNGTMPIGDIESGLDVKSISAIVKEYNNIVASECVECPINKVCGVCFAQVCGNGEFEKPNCQAILNLFKMSLSIVYTVLEQNPHAYDKFLYRDEWILNS